MADFNKSIDTILAHEGGLSSDARGGATNYGISLRFLQVYTKLDKAEFKRFDIDNDDDIDAVDIKNLKTDDAKYLYSTAFWKKYNCGFIKDQTLATKFFDLCVNMGGMQAGKCLQRAVRAVTGLTLKEDGIIGLKTLEAVNNANPKELLAALKSEAAGFYRVLIKIDPSLNQYLNGWLNRSYS